MSNDNTQVVSEIVLQAEHGNEYMDFHLVSFMEETEERFGIYIETDLGGAMVAKFDPTVDFNVAVSMTVALVNSTIVGVGSRAMNVIEPVDDSELIVPNSIKEKND